MVYQKKRPELSEYSEEKKVEWIESVKNMSKYTFKKNFQRALYLLRLFLPLLHIFWN